MRAGPAARAIGPAILVGLLGFTVTLQARVQGHTTAELQGRRAELARIVSLRQARTAELEQRLADLRAQAGSILGSAGQPLRSLRASQERLALIAGTAPLRGEGIVVTLRDAGSSKDVRDVDSRIQDVDIQAVVNALWDAGSEAIAINGQRLVGTSAIRNAGQAVLVNYRVLTPPYRVSAIGSAADIRRIFERSEIARRFRGWADIYGLGFGIEAKRRLDVPAYSGSLSFRYANEVRT